MATLVAPALTRNAAHQLRSILHLRVEWQRLADRGLESLNRIFWVFGVPGHRQMMVGVEVRALRAVLEHIPPAGVDDWFAQTFRKPGLPVRSIVVMG